MQSVKLPPRHGHLTSNMGVLGQPHLALTLQQESIGSAEALTQVSVQQNRYLCSTMTPGEGNSTRQTDFHSPC